MSQKEAKQMPEFDENLFRERFIELREDYDMKQAEFADFLGIPTGSVGGYESGKKFPNGKTLFKISKKCNISADYLIGLSDVKSPDIEIKAICDYIGLSEMSVNKIHFYHESNMFNSEIISEFIAPDIRSTYYTSLLSVANMLESYEKKYIEMIEEMKKVIEKIDKYKNLGIFDFSDLEPQADDIANEERFVKLLYFEAFETLRKMFDGYVDDKIKTPERELIYRDFWRTVKDEIEY